MTSTGTKELAGTISLPHLPAKSMPTCGNQHSTNIHYLTCLYQASTPHASINLSFSVKLPSVLVLLVLSPRKPAQTLPTLYLPTHVLCRASTPPGVEVAEMGPVKAQGTFGKTVHPGILLTSQIIPGQPSPSVGAGLILQSD